MSSPKYVMITVAKYSPQQYGKAIEHRDGFIDWAFVGEQFTMRLSSVAAPVSPVPLPAGSPLL